MQGFLNVLSIAFEESEFQSEIGQSQKQRWVEPSKGTVSRDGYFCNVFLIITFFVLTVSFQGLFTTLSH